MSGDPIEVMPALHVPADYGDRVKRTVAALERLVADLSFAAYDAFDLHEIRERILFHDADRGDPSENLVERFDEITGYGRVHGLLDEIEGYVSAAVDERPRSCDPPWYIAKQIARMERWLVDKDMDEGHRERLRGEIAAARERLNS